MIAPIIIPPISPPEIPVIVLKLTAGLSEDAVVEGVDVVPKVYVAQSREERLSNAVEHVGSM